MAIFSYGLTGRKVSVSLPFTPCGGGHTAASCTRSI